MAKYTLKDIVQVIDAKLNEEDVMVPHMDQHEDLNSDSETIWVSETKFDVEIKHFQKILQIQTSKYVKY